MGAHSSSQRFTCEAGEKSALGELPETFNW